MVTIQILMSTYNGCKYLREQLNSIIGQSTRRSDFYLLIRDDGSTDGTQEILEEYANRFPKRISWYQGEHVGVVKSFLELLKRSDDSATYYAFSDQDDLWLPDKMLSAVIILNQMPNDRQPNLYCCRPTITDENLEMKKGIKRVRMRAGFGNALVENIVVGCSIVMNHYLRDMVIARPPKAESIMMHDRWFYLLASCFGEVFYDESSHFLYRQHEKNVMGMDIGSAKEFFDRVKNVKTKCHAISMQSVEFWRLYRTILHQDEGQKWKKSEKVNQNLALAKSFVRSRYDPQERRKLYKSKRLYRQRQGDNDLFNILLLLGLFK